MVQNAIIDGKDTSYWFFKKNTVNFSINNEEETTQTNQTQTYKQPN